MNCVNHMDRERVAFCQHCGRPLCEECVRRAGSVVFCEGCWTTRASAPMQPGRSGYPPAGGYAPVGSDEPSPGLAALLGFIPGVGAMYNGQYLKGIAHLIVFVMLVALADESDYCGLFVFGWICYMAFDAYHTACARRDGTALPDPFGFNDLAERDSGEAGRDPRRRAGQKRLPRVALARLRVERVLLLHLLARRLTPARRLLVTRRLTLPKHRGILCRLAMTPSCLALAVFPPERFC